MKHREIHSLVSDQDFPLLTRLEKRKLMSCLSEAIQNSRPQNRDANGVLPDV